MLPVDYGQTETVSGTIPTGNITIIDIAQVNVTNYATAQVVDANLVASKIRKDVTVMGIAGEYEATQSDPAKGIVVESLNVSGFPQAIRFVGFTSIPNQYSENGTSRSFFSQTKRVTLNSEVTEIGINSMPRGLEYINFPTGLRIIWTNGIKELRVNSVTLPASIVELSNYSFQYGQFSKLTFKGTPSKIGQNAFRDCDLLTNIYVPWSKGTVANAPWGATNATIHYDQTV